MSLLRKIAFPISLLYGWVVYHRNQLFDIGFYKSKQFETSTICIGNLNVGGTGKTPMVEHLIRCLQGEYKVAVLSRGYKRKSRGFLLASADSTVEALGDEPFQIHSKFPEVVVAVDADRRNAISRLEKDIKPDVILLDDAFQHRRVKAGLNILLTAYGNLYVDDWYLPTGDLRDTKSQAKRADFIIVTKCPSDLSETARNTIKSKLAPQKHQQVLFSHLVYDAELKSNHKNVPLGFFKDTPFTLVTGIANPAPLVAYLNGEGMSFEHLTFEDHHFFTPKELEVLNAKDSVVTTEKDYMRLKGKVKNLNCIGVRHSFNMEDGTLLKNGLADFMKPNS